jgi:hypothetical protein
MLVSHAKLVATESPAHHEYANASWQANALALPAGWAPAENSQVEDGAAGDCGTEND